MELKVLQQLSWVHKYKKYGYRGLVVSHTKKAYPLRCKLKVLNWRVFYRKSYPETALHFNIAFPVTVYRWEHKLENGDLNLMKPKYKSHKLNNYIKSLRNQLKSYKRRSLGLRIKCRYIKLTQKYDCMYSIYKLINNYTKVPISHILTIIHVPKSTYYHKRKAPLSRRKTYNLELVHKISRISRKDNYKVGYHTITGILRRTIRINHKHVQRILQIYGWQCKAFNKNTRKYNSCHGQYHIFPNLLKRDFKTKL